jgi:prevent-host-death family protein
MVMKTETIAAGVFKARCLQIMDDVQRSGSEVIITKHGKSVARLTPVVREAPRPVYGALRGSIQIKGDIIKASGEAWNADS